MGEQIPVGRVLVSALSVSGRGIERVACDAGVVQMNPPVVERAKKTERNLHAANLVPCSGALDDVRLGVNLSLRIRTEFWSHAKTPRFPLAGHLPAQAFTTKLPIPFSIIFASWRLGVNQDSECCSHVPSPEYQSGLCVSAVRNNPAFVFSPGWFFAPPRQQLMFG